MDKKTFCRRVYMNLAPTPQECRMLNLAQQYHESTEAYDRAVCTGGQGPCGEAMPANPHQRTLIEWNARHTREAILLEARIAGIDRQDMLAAIRNAAQ